MNKQFGWLHPMEMPSIATSVLGQKCNGTSSETLLPADVESYADHADEQRNKREREQARASDTRHCSCDIPWSKFLCDYYWYSDTLVKGHASGPDP